MKYMASALSDRTEIDLDVGRTVNGPRLERGTTVKALGKGTGISGSIISRPEKGPGHLSAPSRRLQRHCRFRSWPFSRKQVARPVFTTPGSTPKRKGSFRSGSTAAQAGI